VKVTKKIKVYKKTIKINKFVENRKLWRKFGDCSHVPAGPEKGVTSVADEVFIESSASQSEESEEKKPKDVLNLGIVCRHCGKTGDHWTLKCPYFKQGLKPNPSEKEMSGRDLESALSSTGSGPGKYVPPSMRSGAGRGAGSIMDERAGRGARDEAATIRVTNLSEDTKESDLSDLFRPYGPISRIYLAKDKITGLSKGFAFINFVHREDAARAIEKLSGYGYDHLILHLEWAKPSNK